MTMLLHTCTSIAKQVIIINISIGYPWVHNYQVVLFVQRNRDGETIVPIGPDIDFYQPHGRQSI